MIIMFVLTVDVFLCTKVQILEDINRRSQALLRFATHTEVVIGRASTTSAALRELHIHYHRLNFIGRILIFLLNFIDIFAIFLYH